MSIYDTLNKEQAEAVFCTEGPLLILAGAGSGKTRVLTHRIAYLMDEEGVNGWNILAITFTNKAAQEMRERVDKLVDFGAQSIWVSTFHSACVRILRRYADRLGYGTNFTIYDTEDQKSVMKDVCRRMEIDTKRMKEKVLLGAISSAKNELVGPDELEMQAEGDFVRKRIAAVYREYQKQLKSNNAMDFDDLIFRTVELFQECPDVLEYYQERFRYIMVDEYQDTNTAQFKLVSLLAGKYRNLCVVGDDDQSIYRFRGANIGNILNFEKVFPDARVIKLEQNYRSTQNILDAANAVIRNNRGRKEKSLWTENGEGERLSMRTFDNGYEEADYVCRDIRDRVHEGVFLYKDCAILYRTNAQSRLFEERFVSWNVPYKIVGGVNFYSRKEIKDILAYLKTIDNGQDDLAVKRIINVPKRGIGAATLNKVSAFAEGNGMSFYEALEIADNIPSLGKSSTKIIPFTDMIHTFRIRKGSLTLTELVEELLDRTGYLQELKEEETEEAEARIENIDEFLSKVRSYEESCEEEDVPVTLGGFLEEVALVADIDSLDAESDHVVLMTLHSAKGLEFPNVYLAGMEDGLFPGYMSITSDDREDLEEERRLCYVGITRAMKRLTLSAARMRMIRGENQFNKVSRFVKEIPAYLMETGGVPMVKEREVPKSGGYAQAKSMFQSKAFEQKNFTVTKAGALDYEVGDTVRHIKFGVGVVKNIVEGGRDYEVTVDFVTAGTKKMFASFAKLKKE